MAKTIFLLSMIHNYYLLGNICPAGHYCPPGSRTPLQCPPGKYCSNAGLSAPTGNCSSGYYCSGKATTPTQHGCPPGNYCPEQSRKPSPCPEGTFSNATLNRVEGQCANCTPGYYCDKQGMDRVAGMCAER